MTYWNEEHLLSLVTAPSSRRKDAKWGNEMVEQNHHNVAGSINSRVNFSGAQGRGEHVVLAHRRGCDQNADSLPRS